MHRTGGIERFLNAFVVNCSEKLEWDISRILFIRKSSAFR